MNTLKTTGTISTLIAGALLATSVSAATVDFTDFTTADWNGNLTGSSQGNTGESSISNDGVTVSSTGGNITYQVDGLGVAGGSENDEVDNAETLTINFDTAVNITSIWLDDFWNATDKGQAERARVTVNGDQQFELVATKDYNPNTDPTVFDVTGLFSGPVTSLLFEAVNFGAPSTIASDYSLSGIEVAAVPVPAAFWLLGSAMVFLFRKRQMS